MGHLLKRILMDKNTEWYREGSNYDKKEWEKNIKIQQKKKELVIDKEKS